MKVISQSGSIDSKKRAKILGNWNESKDTYKQDGDHMGWTDLSKGGAFPYDHKRPLPMGAAEEAIKYIKAIAEKYPLQLRYVMAMPLWHRFADAWCETGDLKKALRGI